MSMDSTPDTRTIGRELIDAFAKGWSKAKLDLIMSVFSDDAVFVETPFTAPVTGAGEIRKWWADVPYNQSEITCTMGEIYAAGPWFSTEFKVTFRRRRTGEWVEARGAIFCETGGGKITEMRMYWHRWVGGREV
jgi:ketosteroid isomerase-like protein